MIPLYEPCIRGREWEYVKACLDSGWVSSVGAFVERFEADMASVVGHRYGVATASGTAALHTALLVAGVEPGDEVIVSALTFIAPINAVRYCGAYPVLIDAEPQHWQLDGSLVETFLRDCCTMRDGGTYNCRSGRRVRAIVAVDLYGHPVDAERIAALAASHGVALIEDASESLGASYRGRSVGQRAEIACFSFNGNKIITTGGGGMLTTDRPDLAKRARYLTTQAKDDPVEYVHNEVGYNYRLTNLQAAMGVAQLEQLAEFVERKRGIKDHYRRSLAMVPGVRVVEDAPWADATGWLVNVEVESGDSRPLLRSLLERGIQTRPVWMPGHMQRPYRKAEVVGGDVSETIYRRGLSLPSSVDLPAEDVEQVVRAISEWATA